ncbi:MAG TPA: alpha/beta hydrolase [Solirubrobacterales bacterium]|jgi:pimeloyl-ACP methyl ester carboxylesterase|nr:alpha/beta hydrolase [Solirubrobacterales bacterium]
MGSGSVGEIKVEGRRLAWRTVGSGAPLLLVNGYAATAADWDPAFLDGLAESFEVICPDNRGVGGSELGDGELTIDGMAADLEALLDALGIERAAVVGWSMGGFVAQQLAERAPTQVSALALLATDSGGPEAVPATPGDWARLVDHSGTPREQATRLISLLFPADLAEEIDRQFGEAVAAARAGLSPTVLAAQEAAMEAWHREPRGESEGVKGLPVLVAHGSLDAVIPPANAGMLAARFPGAVVEVFDGCGHALMAQQPQRLAELIIAHVGS